MQLDKQHVAILVIAALLLGVVLFFALKFANAALVALAVAGITQFFATVWALFAKSPIQPKAIEQQPPEAS